jgi:hypothetical protein
MISTGAIAQEGKGKAKKEADKGDANLKNSFSFGSGIANYFGDLMKNSSLYKQSGFSFSAGFAHEFNPHFFGRVDLGIQQVKGSDSENGGAYPSRNLSFKSGVFDLSVSAEADLSDIHVHKFVPYLFFGVGVAFFNPTAEDNLGNKQKLRDLGTEGQGNAGYPKKYSTVTAILPGGFGFKYAASSKVTVHFEVCYKAASTDHLDDVSLAGYPDPAVLSAQTKAFTWRGAGPYPTNLKLRRGNPDNKDSYYTTQFKIAFKL